MNRSHSSYEDFVVFNPYDLFEYLMTFSYVLQESIVALMFDTPTITCNVEHEYKRRG